MKYNYAYKCRIYPNIRQKELINKTFGCCRKVWNLMLSDRNEVYKKDNKIYKPRPAMYKDKYPYLKEVDSLALSNVQLNLERAFNDFYKDIKSKKSKSRRKGLPKFKSKKKDKRSYTTNVIKGNIEIKDNYIKLPKLGNIKIKLHRKINNNHKLKSVTVSKDGKNDYYVSLLFEYEDIIIKKEVKNIIGIDYKSDGLYIDSNNHKANMPHFYRNTQKKLRRHQKKLSRKVGNKKNEEKSKNYLKELKIVNTIHIKIKNQRKDFLHKLSNEITNHYELICVEDLDMKGISNKKFKNGKATFDNGFGMFIDMLNYKQERKGHYLIKVDKFFPSSQICHKCGYKNEEMKNLSIRTYKCPSCGSVIDRDLNAAINIKKEGLRLFYS